MSAQAGGMCMSQCAHWRIPLFRFPVSRKEKRNACESLRRYHIWIAVLQDSSTVFLNGSSCLTFYMIAYIIIRVNKFTERRIRQVYRAVAFPMDFLQREAFLSLLAAYGVIQKETNTQFCCKYVC